MEKHKITPTNGILDIYSKGEYPADVLSNFYPNAFVFDGVPCQSMEGFLQSLKYKDETEQRLVCSLVGKEAKEAGQRKWLWKWTGNTYWKGKKIRRKSDAFKKLILDAYVQLFQQNDKFYEAVQWLTVGQGKSLEIKHTIGKRKERQTILTEQEFVFCIEYLRKNFYCLAQKTQKNNNK